MNDQESAYLKMNIKELTDKCKDIELLYLIESLLSQKEDAS